MKSCFRILTTVALGVVLCLSLASQPEAADSVTWRDLPRIALEECVALTHQLMPHPVIRTGRHFLAVTSYEEKPNEEGEISQSGTFLNVYVLNGLAAGGDPLRFRPLEVHLIVERWAYDQASATKTVYQWLFLDYDRDGLVDRAAFQTIVEDSANQVLSNQEMQISGEELGEIHHYFTEAVDIVNKKTEQEPSEACVPS